MKKLSRLNINSDKLIESSRLNDYRGGERLWMCEIWCDSNFMDTVGFWTSHDYENIAEMECAVHFADFGYGTCCCDCH